MEDPMEWCIKQLVRLAMIQDDLEAAMNLCEECGCSEAIYECFKCGKGLCENCAYFDPTEDDFEEEPTAYCEECFKEEFGEIEDEEDASGL